MQRVDWPYRVWFVIGVVAALLAIWSNDHYELFAKIGWTITGPGFTLSQTWNERHDLRSNAAFAILLVFHIFLMETLFPHLPEGHYGYILVIAVVELMTIGLAYQVWTRLRTEDRETE
jgi:hypothetical protein